MEVGSLGPAELAIVAVTWILQIGLIAGAVWLAIRFGRSRRNKR